MSINNAKELSIQSNFLRTKKMLIENNKVPPNFKDKVNEEYSFFWISDCQTEEVLKIRNNKNVIKNLIEKKEISKANHEVFIKNYFNLFRIDFIIKNTNDNYIGGVNIVNKNNIWQIGKYIGNDEFLNKGIAKQMTINLIEFFKINFPDNKEIYSITKSSNKINIIVNQKIGFELDSKINSDFVLMKKVL